MRHLITIIFAIAFFSQISYSQTVAGENISAKPKRGEGVSDLLARYGLSYSKNIAFFNEKNQSKMTSNGGLLLDMEYELPIAIAKYNGKNIRTSLGITDFETAKNIQDYNDELVRKKIKPHNYRKDKILWVPFIEFGINVSFFEPVKAQKESKKAETTTIELSPTAKFKPKTNLELFGEKFKSLRKSDDKLKDHYFYLIAGHGGPDPGAVGFRDGNELHEHEYAYDVTLRLAKKLMESGAEVFMIVQDPDDGIRDERFLSKCGDEFLINGDTISHSQVPRLNQRAEIVNKLYDKNNKSGTKHLLIEVHVDSRITDKRIDIFFYHQPGSSEGERFCNVLLNTIKDKYEKNQPGRGYFGTVTARNLFTLRNTKPVGVYIELGNIQNPIDQIRIIDPNNRQAIANWLFDGIINAYSDKK